jgi:hypothetical protein
VVLFGRKGQSGSAPQESGRDKLKDQPGHGAVLQHLSDKEKTDPGIRERVAAGIVFDLAYQLLRDERGARIENLLAMLASVGGQQCLLPIVESAPPNTPLEQLQLMGVQGHDGRFYLFGDPPNRLLLESADSLLSLAFGAAEALGAPVTMDMIYEEMKKVAATAGSADYEKLDLPDAHTVDRPSEWAKHFNGRIVEALDLYEVPPMRRATAIGFALQQALEMSQRAVLTGHANLDPLTAARIVLQCATRTSKVLIR